MAQSRTEQSDSGAKGYQTDEPDPSPRRRSSRCWPTPRPMAAERSSGSTPTRPRCSLPARAPSRSSARCASRSWTIRRRDKRKAACEAEIEVNRPFAPEIYRGVVAITREPDGAARARRRRRRRRVGGRDAPLRRERDARPAGGPRRIDAAGRRLGRAVRRPTPARRAVDAEPWIRGARRLHRAERCGLSREPRAVFRRAQVGSADAKAAAPRSSPSDRCCSSAASAGLVRRGHGDLHLGNIALLDGRPVLFDAVEFSPLVAPATCSTTSPSCSWI